MRPSRDFLSMRISSMKRAAPRPSARTGSPEAASSLLMRSACTPSSKPMRRDKSDAITMPVATASPCNHTP